jgi:polysaccharide deacetylase family protein (PEP-CTERM system associated)
MVPNGSNLPPVLRLDEAQTLTSSPGVRNALTVDVEDYFHVSAFEKIISRSQWHTLDSRVVRSTHRLLGLFERASVRATFFVLGWVAEHYPALVRDIQSAGHEIGCHGYWHRLVYQQTAEEFREDLCRARNILEDLTGDAVVAYRAPSFSITPRSLWAVDILIEEGFRFDSSIYPTIHDRYGFPGAPLWPHRILRPTAQIWEFPLPVHRFLGYPLPVGGGGYFRLYPYRFTRRELRAINAEGRPFVFYVHPWEVDPEQPRLHAGLINGWRHYLNLRRTEERLGWLLHDFPMGRLTELAGRSSMPISGDSQYGKAA